VENIRPLFGKTDKRRRIPLAEVAQLIGISTLKCRRYAIDGTIPGAIQFGPGKEWAFEKDQLEAWWQKFNRKFKPAGTLEQ
jgi:predicted DNA-binding transcriptional regulator AlpA